MTRTTVLNPMRGRKLGTGESPSLESVINECTHTKAKWGLRQNDIAFALAFWSMVDCGFECISHEKILPKDWKHETRQIYEARFFLPPHFDCPVKLVALPAGDILCLNVLAEDASTKNIKLKSLAIYSPCHVPRPDDDAISCKFSDLSNFQMMLRDLIVWPIRCSILTDQGVMNGSLCGVSDEIKLKIVAHLSVNDVLMLSETCHDLNRICNDQGVWKTFYHQHFKHLCKCSGESEQCDETTDWKETFKDAYTRKKAERTAEGSPSDSYHTTQDGPYGSVIDFDID